MSIPDLEQRLSNLADRVSAPPTDATRQAVRRQAAVLQRRRRTRQMVGSGLLAAAVVAGGLWIQGAGGPADVETIPPAEEHEPPPGQPGELPALSIDALGLEPVGAVEELAEVEADPAASYQVFRRPNDLAGPTVLLHMGQAGDPVLKEEGTPGFQRVAVNGQPGELTTNDPTIRELTWQLDASDAPPGFNLDPYAMIMSWGLSDDELVRFAEGLVSRRQDGAGFDTGYLPQEIREVNLDGKQNEIGDTRLRRFLVLDAPDGTSVELELVEADQTDFETTKLCTSTYASEEIAANPSRGIEEVEALGEPALLSELGAGQPGWCVTWRPTTTTTARLVITRRNPDGTAPGSAGAPPVEVDREVVDEVLGGLREISEDDWQALLEHVGSAAENLEELDQDLSDSIRINQLEVEIAALETELLTDPENQTLRDELFAKRGELAVLQGTEDGTGG